MANISFRYSYNQSVNFFYFRCNPGHGLQAILYPPELRSLSNKKVLRDAILSQSCVGLYIPSDASEEVIQALLECIQSACNVPAPMMNGDGA